MEKFDEVEGQLWEVVGGSQQGGIMVRKGEDTKSPQFSLRLATGAWVEELELSGERLHYKKLLGDGPDFGWVSIKFKTAILLERRKDPPSTKGGAKDARETSSQEATKKMPEWQKMLVEVAAPENSGGNSDVPKPASENPSSLTKEEALGLQKALKEGYAKEDFQTTLVTIIENKDGVIERKVRAEITKHLLTVQSIVLPKYGFSPDAKGVYYMMQAFNPHNADVEFATQGAELNWMLHMDPTGRLLSQDEYQKLSAERKAQEEFWLEAQRLDALRKVDEAEQSVSPPALRISHILWLLQAQPLDGRKIMELTGSVRKQEIHNFDDLYELLMSSEEHLNNWLDERDTMGEMRDIFLSLRDHMRYMANQGPQPVASAPQVKMLHYLHELLPLLSPRVLIILNMKLMETNIAESQALENAIKIDDPALHRFVMYFLSIDGLASDESLFQSISQPMRQKRDQMFEALGQPSPGNSNISGQWLLLIEGDFNRPAAYKVINHRPFSSEFEGEGFRDTRLVGNKIEWKMGGASGTLCRGQVCNNASMMDPVHFYSLTSGDYLYTCTGYRQGDQERFTLRGLADNETEEQMMAGPGELSKLPLAAAGEVIRVRTVGRWGERLCVKPSLSMTRAAHLPGNTCTITIEPKVQYQTFLGIGGSFTESACDLFSKMCSANQDRVINGYFDKDSGIGYQVCRMHTTSCDFCPTGNWSCCDKEGDLDLDTFSMEHYEHTIIPMMRRATVASGKALKVIGSPWSPPAWMKTNESMEHAGSLKWQCKTAWACYYVRFAKEIEALGLPLWGLTVQNEAAADMRWESCKYSAEEERDFVRDYLGPKLEASRLDLKLLFWDHNRDEMFERAQIMYSDSEAAKYVWGMGFHWYGDPRYESWPDHPQVCFENVKAVHELRPDKHLVMTEACQELGPHTGEWGVGQRYAMNIIADLNNCTEAWIDWNLILDEKGGPNHQDNPCSAPVIVDTSRDLVFFQPSYYYLGHFSRYIQPDARRILCSKNKDLLTSIAFSNPDGSITCVVHNESDKCVDFNIKLGGAGMTTYAPYHSITTFIMPGDGSRRVENGDYKFLPSVGSWMNTRIVDEHQE